VPKRSKKKECLAHIGYRFSNPHSVRHTSFNILIHISHAIRIHAVSSSYLTIKPPCVNHQLYVPAALPAGKKSQISNKGTNLSGRSDRGRKAPAGYLHFIESSY